MNATLTSKGQITIPLKVRKRLNLKPGDVLDFDEEAPFLKAVRVITPEAWEKFREGWVDPWPGMSIEEVMEELRGPGGITFRHKAMRTALDSSVLLLLLRRQSGWERWREALSRASMEGVLLMCPVVFAECSLGFQTVEEAQMRFDGLGLAYDAISSEAAWLAGQTYLKYRRENGPREHLLPDFLIAAHAFAQADRLAAVDRGYLRIYFPQLRRLEP